GLQTCALPICLHVLLQLLLPAAQLFRLFHPLVEKLDEAVKRPGAHPVIPLLSFGHPLQVGQLPPQAFEGSCHGWIPPYSASPLLSPQDPSRIPLIRKAVLVTLKRSTTDGAR